MCPKICPIEVVELPFPSLLGLNLASGTAMHPLQYALQLWTIKAKQYALQLCQRNYSQTQQQCLSFH
jgi:hypothetical protein